MRIIIRNESTDEKDYNFIDEVGRKLNTIILRRKG